MKDFFDNRSCGENSNDIFILVASLIAISIFIFILAIHVLNDFYPFNTFLFRPLDRFGDTYKHVCGPASTLSPYFGQFPQDKIYNPFAFLYGGLCSLDYKIPAVLFFLTFAFLSASFVLLAFIRSNSALIKFDKRKVILSFDAIKTAIWFVFALYLGLSYPMLITMDRMNLELYGLLFLLGYILRLEHNDRFIFLGLFFSLKVTYLLYILFCILNKERLAVIASALIIALALNLAALNYFYGSDYEVIHLFTRNLDIYSNFYQSLFNPFTQSIYNLISLPYFASKYLNYDLPPNFLIYQIYMYKFIFLLGLISSYFVYKNRSKFTKYELLLYVTVFIMIFEMRSADYRSIFMTIPFLFLATERNRSFDKTLLSMLFVYFLPKNLSLSLINPALPWEFHLGYLINPLILLFIFFKTLFYIRRKT